MLLFWKMFVNLDGFAKPFLLYISRDKILNQNHLINIWIVEIWRNGLKLRFDKSIRLYSHLVIELWYHHSTLHRTPYWNYGYPTDGRIRIRVMKKIWEIIFRQEKAKNGKNLKLRSHSKIFMYFQLVYRSLNLKNVCHAPFDS